MYYCLVNHDKHFIVCVDPKCGCTTVKDWFIHTLAVPGSDVPNGVETIMVPAETVGDYESYFKILFVRNPHGEERPATVFRDGKFVLKPLWSSDKFLGGVEEREVSLRPRETKVWEVIPC